MLHAVDAVVVLCPDRLARNYVHQMIVLEELDRFGVRVVFCEGGIADDPQGRLLVQIQAAVAEFEQTKIVERNRRGNLFGLAREPSSAGQSPSAIASCRLQTACQVAWRSSSLKLTSFARSSTCMSESD